LDKGGQVEITQADVLHVSILARLRLEPQELVSYQRELSEILSYMEILQGIDTTGVAPTFHSQSITNALRDDSVQQSQSVHDAQRNAPCMSENTFVVPKVID
jgi:aspartyl-tRNA(Asn)/glutamyl-tRNA(Gln) amidotransferase subunit C